MQLLVVFFLLGDSLVSEFYVPILSTTYKQKVFRNVGTYNSDAGESPKRKNTKFRTWQKFEIKT